MKFKSIVTAVVCLCCIVGYGNVYANVQKGQKNKKVQSHVEKTKKQKIVLKSNPIDWESNRNVSLIVMNDSGETKASINDDKVRPIASITKLMVGIVATELKPNWSDKVQITEEDIDALKHTHSMLKIGSEWSREQLLKMALIASDNRAAHALARSLGGVTTFVAKMNDKAKSMKWNTLHFEDPTGLTPKNVGSAKDVLRMTQYAKNNEFIQQAAQTGTMQTEGLSVRNTNGWIRTRGVQFNVSKTGFTNEAGRCITVWKGSKGFVILGSRSIWERDAYLQRYLLKP